MKIRKTILITGILACALLMLVSCSELEVYHSPGWRNGKGHGPPAHARAHGYRRKQVSGMELTFDTELGLYIVVGRPSHYYCDGYFYRYHGSVWQISSEPDNGWKSVSDNSLPPGLQNKNKMKNNKMAFSAL